ncbi:MAG: hypothetical protein M1436_00140, partial [Acidobacteria bacterium]|nr:hypothetical protein [Acidobacteriota bacterium]
PWSSATTKALVAGRYEDTARTSGVATVVPTAAFRSSNAYVRPNAEYVVLLYGAVWAAPRHTFATVLERPLDGVGSFQFSWYVCAGAFDQARAFADKQPAMQGDVLPRMASAPAPAIPTHNLVAVPAACQVTEYKMQPNQPEQAVILKDPAGEQTVLFDVTQGGAIVSHKYKGQESVWGYNGGGLLQMAFHNGMTRGPWSGDYNPTQAGDGSAMSPVTGIACEGTSAVNILTMMLDFNHNNAFYDRPLIAVWGGRVNDMVPLSFFSPYTLETRARWVPNPSGEPKYYLKMEERLVHIADEKIGNFGFDFAYYADWGLGIQAVSPAEGKQANYVAGGFYKDDAHTVGMAVGMPSSNFPGKRVGGGGTTEPMWRNHSFHLGATDTVDGITSKEFVWYIMAGPWKNAEAFAKKF